MNKEPIFPKRALISVSDKSGLAGLVQVLHEQHVELISTGGTHKAISDLGLPVKHISEITDFPEIMQGRIKTLHPLLLGGILGKRDDHSSDAKTHNIQWIDLVICNLYPFEKTIQQTRVSTEEAIENIDIGGPTMVRAAAKNLEWVGILTNPNDYSRIADEIVEGGISFETRQWLSQKAFAHTAYYDSMIANYFLNEPFPQTFNQSYRRIDTLRYGENPHQKAAVYRNNDEAVSVLSATQLQGKQLSFNNLVDAQAAIDAVTTLREPRCAVIKHAQPCGMAEANMIEKAFQKAFMADEKSAFGGVIALNKPCNHTIATELSKRFVEIVIAPDFSEDARSILSKKVNLRLLQLDFSLATPAYQIKHLPGGLLLQEKDTHQISDKDIRVVTGDNVTDDWMKECLFAWDVVKNIKSNAIVITNERQTQGIGGGQVSRVDAVEIAIQKAGEKAKGGVLASDAFFPFRDSIDLIAKAGIQYVIQPGGSKRDDEVIDAAKDHNITMIFTGIRSFNH